MTDNNLKSIIESLIFISGKPIKISKLARICKSNIDSVTNIVYSLSNEYKKNNRGIRILIKKDSVQMVSAPENANWTRKLITDELTEDLSPASLETLAIIAYRGPISRASIEAIRGVNCVYILRSLLIRGLIDKKRSEKDARMSIYEVSFDFLKHLGIENVKDLPNYEELNRKSPKI